MPLSSGSNRNYTKGNHKTIGHTQWCDPVGWVLPITEDRQQLDQRSWSDPEYPLCALRPERAVADSCSLVLMCSLHGTKTHSHTTSLHCRALDCSRSAVVQMHAWHTLPQAGHWVDIGWEAPCWLQELETKKWVSIALKALQNIASLWQKIDKQPAPSYAWYDLTWALEIHL